MLVTKLPLKVVQFVERARSVLGQIHQRSAPPYVAMMELIFEEWTAQAITAAVQLGVPDALADGPLPIEELASRVNANPDALRRLLRALIGRGIFRQRKDGRYELNGLADTLRSKAAFSTAGPALYFGSQQHREVWSHLADAIRTGEAVVPALTGTDAFDYLNQNPDLVEVFHQAMANTTEMAIGPLTAAYPFADFPTIVDLGGGVGQLLAAILTAAPNSKGILYDLPNAVTEAPQLLSKCDVADRVQVMEGSFFDGVPSGGDLYVIKNVLHDWPDEDAIKILRSIRNAVPVGTTLLIVEFVISEKNHANHVGHWTDLEMLVMQAGRERTGNEYGKLLEAAGFAMTRLVPTVSPLSFVEARAR